MLGKKAKDVITGFEGIIIGKAEYLYGCTQYGVAPECKEGKREAIEWFDEGRLRVTGDGVMPESVQSESPGCENNEHPR